MAHVFRRSPDVEAVYLFESRAGGSGHAGSDFDLAVVPARSACKEGRVEMLADMARMDFAEVDLVFDAGDSLVLAYGSVRPSQGPCMTDQFDRGAHYSRVVRM